MKKIFTVKNIEPQDLLRWEKEAFYNFLDDAYRKEFRKDIEILDCEMSFVKDGIKIKITNFRERD